jgi:GNAT superfamily N-acetyltransferase
MSQNNFFLYAGGLLFLMSIFIVVRDLRCQWDATYWIRTYLFSLDKDFCDQHGGDRDIIAKPGRFRYVASQSGAPVGFVEVKINRSIVIRRIYVDHQHRRRGVGKMLIQHLLTQHPDLSIMVRVDERFLEACLFFRESGFACVAMERDYYDGHAALIFKRKRIADGHHCEDTH